MHILSTTILSDTTYEKEGKKGGKKRRKKEEDKSYTDLIPIRPFVKIKNGEKRIKVTQTSFTFLHFDYSG